MRAAGSEFAPACDMRLAARESAIFAQFEPACGALPGGGAAQHLTRLMGRGRALEVMLSARDYDAEPASSALVQRRSDLMPSLANTLRRCQSRRKTGAHSHLKAPASGN